MALALAFSCSGFVSPIRLYRPSVVVLRGPAGPSMMVKGLGADSDTRPIEMIHADADAAFKMLDADLDGSIDDEDVKKHLYGRGYTEELVNKVFAGIDVDSDGTLSTDELRAAFVKFPTLVKAFEVETRSVWPAMDDGMSEADIFALADKIFALVDTDGNGDISVDELKGCLLSDGWEDELVTKVFNGIDFDTSGEIDKDELREAFVKYPSLRAAMGKRAQ
jgi:Ca2+-binding EF-hand superfamily protein